MEFEAVATPKDKETKWGFTAYESQWPLFDTMNDVIAEWGWQTEICPTTERKHYQGYIRTKRQCRFAQMVKILPGVHIYQARNWQALKNYCNKTNTAVPGSQIHQVNPSQAMTMAQALDRLAIQGDMPDIPDHWAENDKRDTLVNRLYTNDYWDRVMKILREDENLIGLYSQPQYLRAWLATFPVWIDRQTDRQKEVESEEA